MGRKKREVNQESAKRLKQLIKESGIKYSALAKKVHCSQQHLCYMANGQRTISPDMAKAICEQFPGISVAWLLCMDDHRTTDAAIDALLRKTKDLTDALSEIIIAAARNSKYQITYADGGGKTSFYLERDGEDVIPFTRDEKMDIANDILDYTAFLLQKYIRKKKGDPDPVSRSVIDFG